MNHDPRYPFFGVNSSPPVPYPGNTPQGFRGDLGRGRPLGKSSILRYATSSSIATPKAVPTTMLQFDNETTEALTLTLLPPLVALDDGTYTGSPDNYPGPYKSNSDESVADAFAFADAYAIVEWGCGGVNTKLEADILNGLCLNLTASYVRAYAVLTSGSAGSGGGTPAAFYQMSAFIGRGHPKPINAQRTLQCPTSDNITPSVSILPVPRFAKTVQLCGCDRDDVTAPWSATIRFWRGSAGPGSVLPIATFTFNQTSQNSFRVPNGAYYFDVLGGVNAHLNNYAVFDLAV